MLQSHKILVIDDDMDIRECLKDVLESEGYSVTTAKDGQEGIDILENAPLPDLILLDLMMPVVNAFEFVDRQKRSQRFNHVKTLVMSADKAIQQKSAGMHVSGYIKKPFSLDELIRTVRQHCA